MLRGVAALTIVLAHFTQNVLPEVYAQIPSRFDPGTFGVFLFFLVSGYIVPASLERRGNIRDFWISRFFRIYPLCAVVVAVGVVAFALGAYTPFVPQVMPFPAAHPLVATLSSLTMLHDFQGVGPTLFVMWTLSYEMAFYLLVASLFVFRVHRRSAEIALGLSLVGAAGVSGVPVLVFAHTPHEIGIVVTVSAVLMALGLATLISRRRAVSVVGALVLTGLVLVLVSVNSRLPFWVSMAVLATMFAGTAIYRAEHNQITWLRCGVTCLLAASVLLVTGTWLHQLALPVPAFQLQWLTAMLATWGLFAAGLSLRHRRIFRPLTWLGEISYSVYLTHAVVLSVVLWVISPVVVTTLPMWSRLGLGLLFCCIVLVISHVTFRLIEQPAQRFGRRLSKRLGNRPGAVTMPAGQPGAVASRLGSDASPRLAHRGGTDHRGATPPRHRAPGCRG
jgi:peptidoglycan/LPS O-acetylase OafA/YrhL